VVFPTHGGLHPGLFHAGLLEVARRAGATVIGYTPALRIDGTEQTFHAGDAWWEPPGAIHRVSRNASSTEPATLLAIYVAPKSATADDLMKPI
jgi:Cupin domain